MTRAEKLAKQAEKLTTAMPPGTPVRYWIGAKGPWPRAGNIKHPFGVSGYSVVGWVDTHAGCIAASHIEAIQTKGNANESTG
jgi:hypothetical protein